jgi:Spy/CpxP family protein refolding chaperone
MNNKLSKIVVISLVVVVIMSLAAVAAFAQDDTAPDAPTAQALPFGRGGFHGHDDSDRDEALAAALGITVEELQAARRQAAVERIAQAVEEGLITQEQADTMLAMQALHGYLDREAILAEVLGMTVDELALAREDGTLHDLLANITPADLQASIQAATESAVAQAVEDGVITQAQADLVLEQLAYGMGIGARFGGHHGGGGGSRGRGGFNGFGGTPQTDDAGEAFAPFAA